MTSKTGGMPNNANSNGGKNQSDTDSGKGGSNQGASGGLRKSNDQRADVTKSPTTDNRFPNGLA